MPCDSGAPFGGRARSPDKRALETNPMAEMGTLSWGNIEVEFDKGIYAAADVADAIRRVEARNPGFGDRVPPGTLIALSRHSFSGDYVGDYQVDNGRPREVARRAWSARRAVRKLLDDIASRISADISPLRPRNSGGM